MTPTPPLPPGTDPAVVLAAALDAVLADPGSWDQTVWGRRSACGTAYCLAGHVAVTVLGWRPRWYGLEFGTGTEQLQFVDPPVGDAPPRATADQLVDVVAARALGLVDRLGAPDDRADDLFSGGQSLRRLVELAWLHTAGRVDRFAAYAALAAARPGFAAADRAREDERGFELAGTVAYLRAHDDPPRTAASWMAALATVY